MSEPEFEIDPEPFKEEPEPSKVYIVLMLVDVPRVGGRYRSISLAVGDDDFTPEAAISQATDQMTLEQYRGIQSIRLIEEKDMREMEAV